MNTTALQESFSLRCVFTPMTLCFRQKWCDTAEGIAQAAARKAAGGKAQTFASRLVQCFELGWFAGVSDAQDNGMEHTEWIEPALQLLSVSRGDIVMELGHMVGHGVVAAVEALERAKESAGQQPHDRIKALQAKTEQLQAKLDGLKAQQTYAATSAAVGVAEQLGHAFLELHELCLAPDSGKVWVVTPDNGLARELVEEAFSRAAETKLHVAARSEVGEGARAATAAASKAALAVQERRWSVATQVEEAKACEHYDKVQAHMQKGDLLENIQRSLAEQEESLRAQHEQAHAKIVEQKQRAAADAVDDERETLLGAERHAITHVVDKVLSVVAHAVAAQRAYELVSAELISDALAVEERAQTRAKELRLEEIGEITREQDSAVSMLERHFRRSTMSRQQIAELDGKLEAIKSEAAEELGAAEAREAEAVDAARTQREAVEVAVEVARQRLEEAVELESREGVPQALGEADAFFERSCADAKVGAETTLTIAERSAYERGRAADAKYKVQLKNLRDDAGRQLRADDGTCSDALESAEQRKQQKFEAASARLAAALSDAAERCAAAEAALEALEAEAEKHIAEHGPAVRKEARQAYVQHSPLLEFAEADPLDLQLFADDSVDKILTVNTLYFFPDLMGALKELRRVLRPNGLLVCVVKCAHVHSGMASGRLPPTLPADAEVLLQALRETGFGASVRASGSVSATRKASAAELAEKLAEKRRKLRQAQQLRSLGQGVEAWRAELEEMEVRELVQLAKEEGVGQATLRTAQMADAHREALVSMLLEHRQRAAAAKEAQGRPAQHWAGTVLSDEMIEMEFVPRISARMQQCAGCQRRVPGVSGLVWSTVFFPRHVSEAGGEHGRHDGEGMRLCAECHTLKVEFALERRALAAEEEQEESALAAQTCDGTTMPSDEASGRLDYEIIVAGPVSQKNVAARELDTTDLLSVKQPLDRVTESKGTTFWDTDPRAAQRIDARTG